MAATKRKSGPRMVYARDRTETLRVSALAKRLMAAGSARTGVSVGDFVEHVLRTRAAAVTRDEFPADEQPAA